MKNQKFSIAKVFTIYGIIQAVVGAIAILGGIASYASKESTLDLIIAGAGLVALLFTPFTISWGQVVEDTRRTADNTELLVDNTKLLVEHCSTNGILYDKSGATIVYVSKAIQGSVTIPDNVTNIGNDVFRDCFSLTSVTIGNSVTSIGAYAFCACSKLTSITYQGTKAQWNAISKGYCWNYNTGNYTIHCTDGDIKK